MLKVEIGLQEKKCSPGSKLHPFFTEKREHKKRRLSPRTDFLIYRLIMDHLAWTFIL